MTVPQLITIFPLESIPSPDDVILQYPPAIVSVPPEDPVTDPFPGRVLPGLVWLVLSTPPEMLIPSSVSVRYAEPQLRLISFASSHSYDLVILMFPPLIVKVESA